MMLYNFTNADHGLSNIVNKRIKVAEIDKLNDPFEFRVYKTTTDTEAAFEWTFKDLADNYGIICFSEHWHHPMMWSHYSDNHKGICLGFEVDDRILKKVRYIPQKLEPPDDPTNPDSWTEEHLNRMLYSKFEDWKYEAEWRLAIQFAKESKSLRQIRMPVFQPIGDKILLKEVILGSQTKISEVDIKVATEGFEDKVIIRKAMCSPHEYKVIEDTSP